MKTLKSNFGLCVISIVSLLCLNFWMSDLEFKDDKNRECSPNNVLQSGGDILGFYTDLFSMNPQSVDVVSFPKMNPTTTISVTGQTINFNPSSVILPTNTSSFNPITQDLVCLISREGLMLEYNDILPSSSIHSPPVPSPTSAPQFFNNSLYGIAIPNNSGSTVVNFEIVSDLQSNYPVGIAPGNFAPSSGYLFNHEQISSSTNGTNEIYFVSGTNFIIFDNSNPLNPSTNWIDLGPSNDYAYYGLEYKSQGKHLALRYNINTLTIELVEITIIGGALISINQLYDLQAKLVPSPAGWILNREFYSTTLDTCDMKYYLSTLFDPNGSSRLIAIDLMKNTHDEQHNSKYLFGIEWKGLPCDKCKCGTYSDINYRPFQGAPNQNAECGDTLIAQCNGNNPWTMNGNFLCSGNMCPSSTQMTWILTKPNTSVISNTITSNPGFNISIPANEFDQSGSYQLSIQAVCDQDTCVCDFNINVECDPCCTDFDDFCERIESAVTISIDNDSCKVKLMLDSLDCNNYLEYIDWGDSTFDNGPIPPNGMAMHVYPASGTYIISYLAIELDDDGFICFEKIVNDTITLNCITCDCPGNSVNLVTNGDFSSGKTGFTSDLPCNSNCGHGSYSIGTNFKTKCSGWPNVPDHTGGTPGNLMIIDGDPNNYPIVWSQQVNVTPGETYCFSYWTASVYCESQQDFILTSTIGTETIGQSIIKEKCQAGIFPQWINHSFNWTNTSNLSGLQNLQIIQSTGSFGVDYSDFGLDDICFAASTPPDSCCTDFDAFCERIESAVTISIDNDSCKVKLTLDSLGCNNYLEYIDWGDSTFDNGPIPPNGMAMHVYSGSGTYVISYLAIELDDDGFICFEKIVNDTITIMCNDCPCSMDDIHDLSVAVNKGFATVSSSLNCQACFAPIGLTDCETVQWYLGDLTNPLPGSSIGNQMYCYDFVNSGSYTLIMVVTRYKPDGSICEVFTNEREINVSCSIVPACENPIIPNPGFNEGAIAGGLDPGGIGNSNGWTALSGVPVVTEGTIGSLDGWTIELANESALTTVDPTKFTKEEGTISFDFGIKEKGIKSPIIINIICDDFEWGESPESSQPSSYNIATIDVEQLELDVWYNLQVPYNLGLWDSLDSCNLDMNSVVARPVVYSGYGVNPTARRNFIEIDQLCVEDESVAIKNISNINSINIYPNPTSNNLTVRFDNSNGLKGKIQIIDLLGKIVKTATIENGNPDYQISLESQPNGIYLVKVIDYDDMYNWSKKFVKQ